MDWVKLHTRFYVDPKVASLPDAHTEMMFVRSLAYAGDQETGGFIPEASLPLLARRRRYAASVKALVASGLWTADAGGYRITRWDDRQEELETLAKRRAADRERKRRQRASQKESSSEGTSRDVSADSPVTVQTQEEEEELSNPPNPPPSGGNDAQHDGTHINCRQCGTNKRGKPKPPPPDPATQQQRAMLAKAEEGNQRARELAEADSDPVAAVIGLEQARSELQRRKDSA